MADIIIVCNCNHIARTGSERINRNILKEKVLAAEEVRGIVKKRENKIFRRTGDRQKDVEDFRNALRALCKYRNKCIE